MAEYETGSLLLVQRGEYSDQQTVGLYRVLKTFIGTKLIEAYREQDSGDEDGWYEDGGDGFMRMLVKSGYVEELNYDVFHTGSYGRLETDSDDDSAADRESDAR